MLQYLFNAYCPILSNRQFFHIAWLIALSLFPSLVSAQISQEVKPECCIAVYGSGDPLLLAQAKQWLGSQTQCATKQLFSFDDATDGDAIAAQPEDCSKLYVGHFDHGPACEDITQLAEVCTDTYQKCDVNLTSVSCRSFASDKDAYRYIKASLRSAQMTGRTVTIVGEQTSALMASPSCSVRKKYTLRESGDLCAVDLCAEPGRLCHPAGAAVDCMYQGAPAVQRCCATQSFETKLLEGNGRFITPNTECSPREVSCQDPPNIESMEAFGLAYGTQPCPGALEGLTTVAPITIVKSCTGAKCQYHCREPYFYDSKTKACVQKYRCVGDVLQPHTGICPGFSNGLTSDQGIVLVNAENCPMTTDHCYLRCAAGYHVENYRCVADYKCVGKVPAASLLCKDPNNPGVTDETDLWEPTARVAVMNCTEERKCEYACKPGYVPTPDGTNCFKPKCLGAKPARGLLCSGSDKGLTQDTAINFMGLQYCAGYQCEYRCPDGYSPDLVGNVCNKIENWVPPPPPKDSPIKKSLK